MFCLDCEMEMWECDRVKVCEFEKKVWIKFGTTFLFLPIFDNILYMQYLINI